MNGWVAHWGGAAVCVCVCMGKGGGWGGLLAHRAWLDRWPLSSEATGKLVLENDFDQLES